MLVENTKQILTRAWSMRLLYLAAILELAGVVWPMISAHVEILVPAETFHTLAIICVAAAPLARVIKQSNLE